MTSPSFPTPHDDETRQILDNIKSYGWTTVVFEPDNFGLGGFAYSLGFGCELGHPEIMVLGLQGAHAAQLIDTIGNLIKSGRTFSDGETVNDVMSGFPMGFRSVPTAYHRFASKAEWLHQGSELRLLQCFWPDANRSFPWDDGCDGGCADSQRLEMLVNPLGPTGDQQLDEWLLTGQVQPVMLMPWAGHNPLNTVYLPQDAAEAKHAIDERIGKHVSDGDDVDYSANPEYDDEGRIPARLVVKASGKSISLDETIVVTKPVK